jgi:peptidoglycan/LPS O-acetylase OafA/YrhL
MRDYIKGLDGLRAIAIVFVVIHHSHFLVKEDFLYRLAEYLGTGVDLFFIISGYLITGILLRQKNRPHALRNFYFRRALRIIPLYYLVLAVAFFIVPQIDLVHLKKLDSSHQLSFWLFFSNYYIAGRGYFQNGLTDLSWSLAVEEQFYIFWSLAVIYLSVNNLKKLALIIIILSPLLRYFLIANGINLVAIQVMSLTRMDTLMMGCLLALTIDQRKLNPSFFPWLGALAFIVVYILQNYISYKFAIPLSYSFVGILYSSILAIVLYSGPSGRFKRFLEWPFMAKLGVYSYGIYLFHNPIQKGLRLLYPIQSLSQALGSEVAQVIFYGVVVMISYFLASMSFRFYESKWLLLKKKFGNEEG